jgi:hypothetical protein
MYEMSENNNEGNGANTDTGAEQPQVESAATDSGSGADASESAASGISDHSAEPSASEEPPAAEPSATEEAASETAVPVTPDEPVTPVNNNITVTFVGVAKGSVEVASGTTAGAALKAAKLDGNLMMRDRNNGVVSKARKLTENITITTVSQARGG